MAAPLTPARRRFFFWLNVVWSALSVGVMLYCANLGLNSPASPDPASGRTFEIQWRIAHVYVTRLESLLFCGGLFWLAMYLIWCFFLDPLRTVRRKPKP